jgi:hypothetical protein
MRLAMPSNVLRAIQKVATSSLALIVASSIIYGLGYLTLWNLGLLG